MTKYFNLADIIIRIKEPIDIPLSEAEKNFLTDNNKYDYDFEFIEDENFKVAIEEGTLIYEGSFFHIYNYKGYELRAFFTYSEKHKVNYYYGLSYIGDKKGYFYYIDKKALFDVMSKGPNQLTYICFEKILLQFDGLILHSSFIKHNNKAILFSAPSGTGKSTQADLWVKHKNATVINGDRTALRKVNNKWQAYGIPMCGTSNIYVNDKMDLEAIVVIRQNKENIANKISMKDGFKYLYSEISLNNWNTDVINKAFDLIMDLSSNLPMYLLQCTKEKEAVDCLAEILGGEVNV